MIRPNTELAKFEYGKEFSDICVGYNLQFGLSSSNRIEIELHHNNLIYIKSNTYSPEYLKQIFVLLTICVLCERFGKNATRIWKTIFQCMFFEIFQNAPVKVDINLSDQKYDKRKKLFDPIMADDSTEVSENELKESIEMFLKR